MTDEITVLSIEDQEAWIAEHRRDGLPSQSWGYAWGLAASGIEPKLAVVRSRGARMLMPFFEREWNQTTDIATLLGLSGASIVPPSDAPLLLWHDFARRQGWVAGYIQLSIFLETLVEAPVGDVVSGNSVFLLDLQSGDGPLSQISRTIRRKLRHAADSGAVLVEDQHALAKRLVELYPLTMRRVGAAPIYTVSPETLIRWAHDNGSLTLGAKIDGSIEAVYVFRFAGPHAESHILGATDKGRDLIAWLIERGAARLKQNGVRWLNLGGGVRPGDGVYRFKARFNGVLKPLRAIRQVYDSAKYQALCDAAGVSSPQPYFPAYRAASPLQDRALDPGTPDRTECS